MTEPADGGAVAIAFCELLQMIGTPAVLLDGRGYVVAANELIHRSLENELQIVNGRLASPDPAANAAVGNLVKRVINGERQSSPQAVSIRRSCDLSVVLYGFQLRNPALASLDPTRAMLVLVDPRSRLLPSELQLKEAFELSWMEARLALGVAMGDPLDAAAIRCGVTYESARSLIKSAFRKTGTHRQAELVALVHSLAIVPRPFNGMTEQAPPYRSENHA